MVKSMCKHVQNKQKNNTLVQNDKIGGVITEQKHIQITLTKHESRNRDKWPASELNSTCLEMMHATLKSKERGEFPYGRQLS